MDTDLGGCEVNRRVSMTGAIGLSVLMVWSCKEKPLIPSTGAPPLIPAAREVDVPITRGDGRVSVQLMVDESGSMAGFGALLPRLEEWIWRGVSRTASYGYDLDDQSNCSFNRAVGVVCGPQRLRRFQADTNLDQAIVRAADSDLTIILTDGVAATGSSPSSLCASGVDAACIGNQLANAIREKQGRGGLWLILLSVPFSGDLYTERRIEQESFDPAKVEGIADDGVVVNSPRNLRTGELVYHYEGRRTVLAIVMAKEPNAGRAFIAGLREARDTDSSTAVPESWPAFEVYPGYAPQYRWTQIKLAADWPNVTKSLVLDTDRQAAVFQSGVAGQAPGRWYVVAEPPKDAVAHAHLTVLPVAQCVVSTDGLGVQVENVRLASEAVHAKVSIDDRFSGPDCPGGIRISATRNGNLLSELMPYSTIKPELQPRRSFGLTAILKAFYDRMGSMPDIPMAKLSLCTERQ